MKILLALCLIYFGACESLPVSSINRLIKKRMTMMKSTRIINGEDASITDFPWQASLRAYGRHLCGAAVVSARLAVTAAHCYKSQYEGEYTLKVGSTRLYGNEGTVFPLANFTTHPAYIPWLTGNPNEYIAGGSVKLAKAIAIPEGDNDFRDAIPHDAIHPDYIFNQSGSPYDIAIITFNVDITGESEKLAKAVAIPKDDNNFSESRCVITGWGRTNGPGFAQPDVLQKASTVVKSDDFCEKKWRGKNILKSQVCVFTGITGACYGDSGGPLTCGNVLVGVTSWGRRNCLTSFPTVYTRISAYRDWINGFIE